MMVLTHVKEDQIESHVNGLSPDELDILVKYVYKGLGIPRNNGPLFKWHAKVGGSGACCPSFPFGVGGSLYDSLFGFLFFQLFVLFACWPFQV